MSIRLLADLSDQCIVCQDFKPLKRKSKLCLICGVTVCDSCITSYDKKTNSYHCKCPICRSHEYFRNPEYRYEATEFIKNVVHNINYPYGQPNKTD